MLISVVHNKNAMLCSARVMFFFVPGEKTEVDKSTDQDSDAKKPEKDSANL